MNETQYKWWAIEGDWERKKEKKWREIVVKTQRMCFNFQPRVVYLCHSRSDGFWCSVCFGCWWFQWTPMNRCGRILSSKFPLNRAYYPHNNNFIMSVWFIENWEIWIYFWKRAKLCGSVWAYSNHKGVISDDNADSTHRYDLIHIDISLYKMHSKDLWYHHKWVHITYEHLPVHILWWYQRA